MDSMHETVIRLPLSTEAVPFVRDVVRGILMALPSNEDRLYVIRNFCPHCGSISRVCECAKLLKDNTCPTKQ